MKEKLKKILTEIKNKKFLFVIIFFGYVFLNIILNKTYLTYQNIIRTHPTFYLSYFVLINFIIIPILVSTTIILSINKIKDLKTISKKGSSVSILAIFGTLLGGACPHCFVGLFPAFIGLFGTTLTLDNLPLQGFEIQIISGIILIISINYLSKDTVCKINSNISGNKSKEIQN